MRWVTVVSVHIVTDASCRIMGWWQLRWFPDPKRSDATATIHGDHSSFSSSRASFKASVIDCQSESFSGLHPVLRLQTSNSYTGWISQEDIRFGSLDARCGSPQAR